MPKQKYLVHTYLLTLFSIHSYMTYSINRIPPRRVKKRKKKRKNTAVAYAPPLSTLVGGVERQRASLG